MNGQVMGIWSERGPSNNNVYIAIEQENSSDAFLEVNCRNRMDKY